MLLAGLGLKRYWQFCNWLVGQGVQAGRQEGRKEGKKEGEALVLQRLLSRRFGPLPPEVLARIASASEEDINQWVDRILDAACLEDVFRP